jgi:hypothetical protein
MVETALRRQDTRTAEKVQCGISLLHIAGQLEARRYLNNCGISQVVIERVLGYPPQRRQLGLHASADRRQ